MTKQKQVKNLYRYIGIIISADLSKYYKFESTIITTKYEANIIKVDKISVLQ